MSLTKVSDVVAEAKRHYIPYITRYLYDNRLSGLTSGTEVYADTEEIDLSECEKIGNRPLVAVVEGDVVDVALQWQGHSSCTGGTCPVVNMANANKPGGDWETVTNGPEESIARRSNLAQALKTPLNQYHPTSANYPIPDAGGLYSPCVVFYRNGPSDYQKWDTFKYLPVISVTPMRRPKLDNSKQRYAFNEEKELMRDKLRSILRIAAANGHHDICLGSFGTGSVWKNPAKEVADMWKELLFSDSEFTGLFKNVIFAFPEHGPDMEVFEKRLGRLYAGKSRNQ